MLDGDKALVQRIVEAYERFQEENKVFTQNQQENEKA